MINIAELLRENLTVKDFRSYSLDKGMKNTFYKIINILCNGDPYLVFEWDKNNKENFKDGRGWFGYTIIGKIIYHNKEHFIAFNWQDNYCHVTGWLMIDNTKVIELTKEVTVWDAGCSSTASFLSINDKINKILL